ncbi:hypothetical protein BLNAU_22409 [Blattamonas nauphoetae]|uniref:Uncharacterized protein n=1 Tax=Blattamonas nauphoetae TaxID=2049346 RepID=A0ABQ9WT64_9EUKA|nr:hypothetical protein BLNAU_22409 [Blattamonas nauphoetae]
MSHSKIVNSAESLIVNPFLTVILILMISIVNTNLGGDRTCEHICSGYFNSQSRSRLQIFMKLMNTDI